MGLAGIARSVVLGIVVCLCAAATAGAAGITNSGDDLRDGWYSNQPRLAPDAVSASTFGQLWDTQIDGQVYAQPLVIGNTVIVATETNNVYALDAETGEVKWHVALATPFPYTLIGWGCGDLTPSLGITATPVIDPATGTVYLTYKTFAPGSRTQAAYYIDALDVASGRPRDGFPQPFGGSADNAPGTAPFDATLELQRPGLLLLGGVVYAGFGGHCDITPYAGWVFGVNATTGVTTARWRALVEGDGAGIWQAGAGLMSDGDRTLYASTGNGWAPIAPEAAPGSGRYGESIVKLGVQADGTLRATDFFAPSDGPHLDEYDADFASGGVTALRDDTFGTTKYPHIAIAVGKAGYVYLLNRDDLGGTGTGPGRGDRVILRVGPYGGVWSRPAVWPGDGGWIAIPTASPATGDTPEGTGTAGKLMLYRYRVGSDGTPSLDTPITSSDAFGFSSSAPVITSQGTTSGTAVLWVIWAPDGSGQGAQLRAYDAAPVNGRLHLRRSFPIGTSSKFTMPGVGSGRIYVGTRDGHVRAYGAPVEAEVQGPATTFPTTTVGETSTRDVTLSIAGAVHVTSIAATGAFAADTGRLALPGDFVDGQTITVPVTFTPADPPGVAGGELTVNTDKGPFSFSLSGTGQGADPQLTVSPPVVSFGGAVVGEQRTGIITLRNAGGQPLTIGAVDLPSAPFSVGGAPTAGTRIAPGDAINVSVSFTPTAVGDFDQDFDVPSDGGDATVGLSGIAGLGPKLSLSPSGGWAFGDVAVGESAVVALTVANDGDSLMSITRSKPPGGGPFTVLDALDEGTAIPAGEHRTIRVRFTPTAPGDATAAWSLNAADGTGAHEIPLTGTGVVPAVVAPPDTTTPPVVDTTPPPATQQQAPPPAITPPSVGFVTGGGNVVAPVRLKADLHVTSARLSRDGRRLAVRGRVARGASGPVGVTLRAQVGRRVVTLVTAGRLRSGATTYAFTLTLPRTMRTWTRLTVTVRFPGSARVAPAVATLALARGR
ncbi:choice-of-anchor D domain-containing protein [Conexibacter woesei]|uniref:choice-of-anchor D domain-containing protein n=1 Tax=Conexibacter woesei TaxID=191495 RepID=UPI001E636842|nr:choice-of-anchor D domain-containing protein [Conexibacter woesei]